MEATLLALPDEIDHLNHQLAWQYPLICPPKRGLQYQNRHKPQNNEVGLFPMKSRKWCNTLAPHCRTFGYSSGNQSSAY
jgi:hypothetical protein